MDGFELHDALLWFQELKEWMAARRQLQSALHVHGGLLIFLGAILLIRRPGMIWIALAGLALLQVGNEVVDHLTKPQSLLWDSAIDCFNTLFWPALIALLSWRGIILRALQAQLGRNGRVGLS